MHFALSAFAAPLFALALSSSALAEPPSAALRLYATGDFLASASSAEASDGAEAHLAAARALIAAAMEAPQSRSVGVWLDRAEDHAEDAVRLAPQSADARLQLAFVLGAKARRTSLAQALAHNYAPRARRLIQEALAREPDNAIAHAMLGNWHLEVLRRGGARGARVYGARLDAGVAEFERAQALAPASAMITIQYAVALLQLDPDLYADRVATLLSQASARAPHDAFEQNALTQAARVAATLQRHGADAALAVSQDAFL